MNAKEILTIINLSGNDDMEYFGNTHLSYNVEGQLEYFGSN